jgi:opacity protein-like surface antigen
MKKLLIAGTVALMLATTASVRAEQGASVTVQGGAIIQSHSECNKDHCLDGRWIGGFGVDYEVLDSRNFSVQPGVYLYHLEYERSYRKTANDKRQNTNSRTANIATAMIRLGVRAWDILKVYGIGGYSVDSFLVYGAGVSLKLDDNWTIETEHIKFDDNCDQHSATVGGIRYTF